MPVDTSVKWLHSAMPGAPTLTGQAGSLIALLDACLVNGWGSGSVDSIVIAAGVATVTRSAGHPFEPGSVALIAGATVTGGTINGEQKAIATTTTTYTFDATGLANQTATGTITHKVAPLGWTKLYAGTNLAAYKSGDPSSTGAVLRVDDTGTTNARVVGYESMSGIDTGVGPFPTGAMVSGGGFWGKSTTADATARVWVLAGDGSLFYFAAQHSVSSGYPGLAPVVFGDALSLKSPDAYRATLYASTASPLATSPGSNADAGVTFLTGAGNALTFARRYTGLGGATPAARYTSHYALGESGGPSGSPLAYPNPTDGGLYVTGISLFEPGGVLRAWLPGLYYVPQVIGAAAFATRDAVTGASGMTGRTLKALASGNGACFIDTTGPWR